MVTKSTDDSRLPRALDAILRIVGTIFLIALLLFDGVAALLVLRLLTASGDAKQFLGDTSGAALAIILVTLVVNGVFGPLTYWLLHESSTSAMEDREVVARVELAPDNEQVYADLMAAVAAARRARPLRSCPRCGGDIATTESRCPACGAEVSEDSAS